MPSEFKTAAAIFMFTYLYAGTAVFAIAQLGRLFQAILSSRLISIDHPAIRLVLSRTRRASIEVNALLHPQPFQPAVPMQSALRHCHQTLCAPTHAEFLQESTSGLVVCLL